MKRIGRAIFSVSEDYVRAAINECGFAEDEYQDDPTPISACTGSSYNARLTAAKSALPSIIAEGRPMHTIKIAGQVDDNHRLSADVPDSVPPGPVTVLIVPAGQEDDAGHAWMTGIAQEWADDLNDPRQDIYILADGEPVRES